MSTEDNSRQQITEAPPRKKISWTAQFNSAKDTVSSVLQRALRQTLTEKELELSGGYLSAKILRVVSSGDGSSPFAVIARIIESESRSWINDGIPNPLDKNTWQGDEVSQGLIEMHPEFSTPNISNFGPPPVEGMIIHVDFKDRSQPSLLKGNGIIVGLPSSEQIGGFPDLNLLASSPMGRKTLAAFQECIKNPKLVASPGFAIPGKNKVIPVSPRNPRKLNSPTADAGVTPVVQPQAPENALAPQGNPGPRPLVPPTEAELQRGVGEQGLGSPTPGSSIDCARVFSLLEFNTDTYDTFSASARGQIGHFQPTWSKSNNNDIANLHPKIRPIVADFINEAQRHGYKLKITSGYRSYAKQNELYARGRSGPRKDWRKITPVPGGKSTHNFGLAVDVCEKGPRYWGTKKRQAEGGKYPDARWLAIARIGKKFGFRWGGNFRPSAGLGGRWDPVHFDMKFGGNTKLWREMIKKGQTIKGTNGIVYPKV